jgi:hypothetical protein
MEDIALAKRLWMNPRRWFFRGYSSLPNPDFMHDVSAPVLPAVKLTETAEPTCPKSRVSKTHCCPIYRVHFETSIPQRPKPPKIIEFSAVFFDFPLDMRARLRYNKYSSNTVFNREGAMENLSLTRLIERRKQICDAIAEITTMRRGTLNEVYRHQKLKDGTIATRGPFYNITTKSTGKTVTVAVPKSDLERVRRETQNYKAFRALSDEYVDVCERISSLSASDETRKD